MVSPSKRTYAHRKKTVKNFTQHGARKELKAFFLLCLAGEIGAFFFGQCNLPPVDKSSSYEFALFWPEKEDFVYGLPFPLLNGKPATWIHHPAEP